MAWKRHRQRIGPLYAAGVGATADLEVVAIKGLLILALLAGGWATAVAAAVVTDVTAGPTEDTADDAATDRLPAPSGPDADRAAPAPGSAAVSSAPYAAHSNEALTALTAQWDTLDVHQRRALLTEVRQRMAQRGPQGASGIQIRTERRYGRLIRQPDGRVIRIETQVVHVRPATEAELQAGRSAGFGVGFEHRSGVERASSPVSPTGIPAGGTVVEAATGSVPAPVEAAQPSPAPALQPVR